jgi:simple sugar transport system permease protein
MTPAQNMLTFLSRQAVTAATPMILAGVGELVGELSGVINIGIEGTMLMGCIAAYTVTGVSGHGTVGLLAAMAAGMVMAVIFAATSVWGRADQIVAGTAMDLLGVGLSGMIWMMYQNWRENLGFSTALPRGSGFSAVPIPVLHDIAYLGPVLFDQYALCYITIGLCVVIWWVLRRTRLGLIIRALGDAPEACHAAGVRVRLGRSMCLLFAGACSGAAGAYLSIMQTHAFASDMTGGEGFVVLALVIFGRWKLPGLIGGCLFFGLINSLQQTLQTARYTSQNAALHALTHVPFQFFQMLPYLAAIIALAIMSRKAPGPRYINVPWPEVKT